MRPARYAFRPAAAADLPMLRRWLDTREVVQWWGAPGKQFALLAEDLSEPAMTMRIVSLDGIPFAYAQDYAVHRWPQAHFQHLPPRTRAIDAFIGEPALLGRGHGSTFLRLLAQRLVDEGVPLVAIDPDPGNTRARRAYFNAGFRGESIVQAPDGPAVLMIFAPSARS